MHKHCTEVYNAVGQDFTNAYQTMLLGDVEKGKIEKKHNTKMQSGL